MSMKKESPLDAHLHIAALQGDVDTLRRVLDSGRVHVDCKDRVMVREDGRHHPPDPGGG